MRWAVSLVGLIAVAATGPGAPAPLAPTGLAFYELPWGVVDARGHRAYLQVPREGGVMAHSLHNGRILWAAPGTLTPIAVVGGRVVGWRAEPRKLNTLRLIVLDGADGEEAVRSGPVLLPAGIEVPLNMAGLFSLNRAWVAGDSLVACWRRAPWGEDEGAAGAIRFDLARGGVEVLPLHRVLPPGPRVRPEVFGQAARPDPTEH